METGWKIFSCHFEKCSGGIAMSKIIKALFDGTDMAEFAMIHLKRAGISIESYEVEPIARTAESGAVNQIVFPVGTGYGIGPDALRPELESLQPFGGVLYTSEFNSNRERRTLDDDIHSSEVRMSVKVPDDQADSAEGILRSCHGYKIRTL